MKTAAYAASAVNQPLAPLTIDRREPGDSDVLIDVLFCGICHSDIHQVRDEWGGSLFPMVPGHEIVGHVKAVGSKVRKHKVGDLVGVGCMVDSCRVCGSCEQHHEQFCEKGSAQTYNSTEMDRKTPTFGGYSKQIVVTEHFVLSIPKSLDPAAAAPLLCAGVTTYSPLRQWGVKKGSRVGIVGLGGLGHMGVKIAAAMGAEVTMLSTSDKKKEDAARLGAKHFANTKDESTFQKLAGSFDMLLDTVSAPHDYNAHIGLLKPFGTMAIVGAPPEPTALAAFPLIMGNKRLAGSLIGGIAETQEMLDFCAQHGIVSDIETIGIAQVNQAYDRCVAGDVRYRFVIDTSTIPST
jgi:uncharacterized zinc-type alcohol dehydrogenase-like protein